MGNVYYCIYHDKKEQKIIYSELMMENNEYHNIKDLNAYYNSSKNTNKEVYHKKSTTSQSPHIEAKYFVNPLPDIVKMKRKKH